MTITERQCLNNEIETVFSEVVFEFEEAIRNKLMERLAGMKGVSVFLPKRDYPYPTTSGPKIIKFPQCDPKPTVQFLVLPLINVEINND